MKPQVPLIRQASREMVRELHLLDAHPAFGGHRLSECHVLTELEILGQATASELCERLVLEKSKLSREIKSLVKRGEIQSLADPADGRRRLLTLTAAGRKGLQAVHQHSNDQVEAALACMPAADSEAVVDGLARYAKALRYARIGKGYRIRPMRRSDNPAVARIIRDVMTEFGAVGCGYSIKDAEVDGMFEAYPAPRAAFYVIEKGRQLLGCGGFAALSGADDSICELRKMYYRPELRGKGLGTQLLSQIVDSARKAGYRRCYLETLASMTHAQRLYQRHGFEVRDGPMGNTGHTACNRFMTLAL